MRNKLVSDVHITTEYITLTQLLKEENIISSGGQAKYFLGDDDNKVFLNGEPENRRGKKLYAGDLVSINHQEYTIKQADNAAELIPIMQEKKAARALAAKRTIRDDRIKSQKAAAAKARKEARFEKIRRSKGPSSWNSHR
ncbi:S4 domain-containing protein YaaA [Leuconostoc fallax]|uniref:S4 domain-containing protein YaaA n=1 Tax=Leuconostoc fallax TaxID=1251 RepID=UPI0010589071|nr:S4 domain-containing protein YaaA [Leuconostoc fallax]MBU7456090.1 S4 domain-containing protein YaaA [Leuconostoc fallax]MCO6184231.1 S4 domain-containing protein YaaA [Leuconostoc fallax]